MCNLIYYVSMPRPAKIKLPFKLPNLLFFTLNGVEQRGNIQPLSSIDSRFLMETIFLPFNRFTIFLSHLESQSHFNGLPSINRMLIFFAVLSVRRRVCSLQCSMFRSVSSGRLENDSFGSSEMLEKIIC